jgi:hypothetical protein
MALTIVGKSAIAAAPYGVSPITAMSRGLVDRVMEVPALAETLVGERPSERAVGWSLQAVAHITARAAVVNRFMTE